MSPLLADFVAMLQIIPPIVVGNFLPRLDSTQCNDHDPAPASHWLCIRSTGMIDVTCKVPSRRAVDRPPLVELKLISGAACLTPIGFLGGNAPAAIGRYIDPRLIGFVANRPSPVTERPTRKEREDIVRGIAANFYDVSSNQVRVSFLQEIRNHKPAPRCVPGRRPDAHLSLTDRAPQPACGNRRHNAEISRRPR